MNRRLITNIALGIAGAFALAVATPAAACDCDKKAAETTEKKAATKAQKAAPAAPAQAPAQEKKADAAKAGTLLLAAADCKCGAKEAKDCKCGEKCHCTDKKDAPKTAA